MSNGVLEGLVKDKDYTFKKLLFKIVKDYNLNVNELVLLIFFLNQDKAVLDLPIIKESIFLEDKDILSAFTSLKSKGLVNINISKLKDGTINETIDLSNVYRAMVSDINSSIKKKSEKTIFEDFEKEFGRPLSPIEFELINAWINSGIKEDLIKGALEEATYNGVRNLRYIDKILYEWGKKGFQSMDDVQNHLNHNNKKDDNKVLVDFDYNWLDDEE